MPTSMIGQLPSQVRRSALPATICVVLLMVFYFLGWTAVRRHAPSMDEPLHAVGSYLHAFEHDYRVNAEDPPLWNYWAMLPHHRGSLREPTNRDEYWDAMLDQPLFAFASTSQWLFQTPGNDGIQFINRSRAVMLVLGVALGAAIAAWTWQLAGGWAAVFASAMFALDPNFLGHAPLIKNDVAITLTLFCLVIGIWNMGCRPRWWSVLFTLLCCAVAPTVKFSGILAVPLLLLLLGCRAALPGDWFFCGFELRSRLARFTAVIATGALAGALSVICIWASYGFRFGPTAVPDQRLAMAARIDELKVNHFYLANGRNPLPYEIDGLPTPLVSRLVSFADDHHLLPHPWLFGFLFTYSASLVRETYLLGEHGYTGWWYYFPLTMLFKTPIATLMAFGGAAMIALHRLWRNRIDPGGKMLWGAICLTGPVLGYGGVSLQTNLNLGLRHILPLYPFVFVGMAAGIIRWGAAHRRVAMPIVLVLSIGLIAETASRFPHYLSFFNVAAHPYRLQLLSDSNLDWGQDLPYVARWQRRNPDMPLYLGYWGAVDPAVYGIQYTNVPGGFILNKNVEWPPSRPGVIALSAGLIQGVNCPPSHRLIYPKFQQLRPKELLGDTIYLYDWPPKLAANQTSSP